MKFKEYEVRGEYRPEDVSISENVKPFAQLQIWYYSVAVEFLDFHKSLDASLP